MTAWQDVADDDDDDDDRGEDGGDDAAGEHLSASELPDPSDTDDADDGAETVPCPFCGRPVYEAADVCPACHSFVGGSDDPTPTRRWPRWFLLALILCLLGTLITCARQMW